MHVHLTSHTPHAADAAYVDTLNLYNTRDEPRPRAIGASYYYYLEK